MSIHKYEVTDPNTTMSTSVFKKSDKRSKPRTTIIGPSAMVVGNIVSDSLVVIDGGIEGDVEAPEALINGLVNGNIRVSNQVEVATNSRITGDLIYKSILIHEGARIFGKLLHQDDERPQISNS